MIELKYKTTITYTGIIHGAKVFKDSCIIHLVIIQQKFLSFSYVPSTVLGIGNAMINKQNSSFQNLLIF